MRLLIGRRKTMNSGGMSTPVERCRRDTMAGWPVATRGYAARAVHRRLPVIFCTKNRLGKHFAAEAHQLIGMKVCAGRWRRRSASSGTGRALFVRQRVLLDLLDDLAVRVGAVTFRRCRWCRTGVRPPGGRAARCRFPVDQPTCSPSCRTRAMRTFDLTQTVKIDQVPSRTARSYS